MLGSYLDKLLKASQGITDDFLKLIHDPNATDAQLKAMQDRVDASRSGHIMVGFYEVGPLKAIHVQGRWSALFGDRWRDAHWTENSRD